MATFASIDLHCFVPNIDYIQEVEDNRFEPEKNCLVGTFEYSNFATSDKSSELDLQTFLDLLTLVVLPTAGFPQSFEYWLTAKRIQQSF